MKAYVDAWCDPCFFLTASLKFGQLAKSFGQMVHRPLPPRAKNCPYAYALWVVVLVNNLDSFFLWNIGIEWENIECSDDCVVWKWCVFNETNKVSCVFNVWLLFLVGRPNLGLPVYFFANFRHVQWAVPQTSNEGSLFIQVMAFHSLFSPKSTWRNSHWLSAWILKSVAGASESVMSSTLKPLTNAQTVRGRPTPNYDNERAFRKGSFCELVGNRDL